MGIEIPACVGMTDVSVGMTEEAVRNYSFKSYRQFLHLNMRNICNYNFLL